MEQTTPRKSALASFPATYWIVIIMEFFERSAFFGMNAMLADYFVQETDKWLIFPHELEGLTREEVFENKPWIRKLIENVRVE